MRYPFAALALLFAASSHADALSDLRTRLQTERPAASISARIELHGVNTTDDDGDLVKIERQGTVEATHDTAGVRLNWSAPALDKARQQKANAQRNPDAPKTGVFAPFDASVALDLLDASPDLLLMLEGAKLVASREEKHEGKPATVLALSLPISMPAKDKKRVKKSTYTATLWVDAEGWPVALESQQYIKSSWMLMSFIADTKTKRTYGRSAGRLFVTKSANIITFEGFGGIKNEEQATTNVTPLERGG